VKGRDLNKKDSKKQRVDALTQKVPGIRERSTLGIKGEHLQQKGLGRDSENEKRGMVDHQGEVTNTPKNEGGGY